jgi:hypothetical protein
MIVVTILFEETLNLSMTFVDSDNDIIRLYINGNMMLNTIRNNNKKHQKEVISITDPEILRIFVKLSFSYLFCTENKIKIL